MNTTIPGLLAAQADKRAEAVAVVCDSMSLTWGQLHDLSLRMSAQLRAQGIKPGDHVALLCGNHSAFLVAWFGLANLGAITVSLNTGLMGDSLRYAITQSDACAIVIERPLLRDKATPSDAWLAGKTLIAFDDEADLYRQLSGHPRDLPFAGAASDPVSLIYTSGTTGLPKGVLNCHQAFIASGRLMVESLRITDQDRILICLPLYHTNPQMYAVMSALHTGCALAVRPRFSVSNFFDDAERLGCTLFTYVGTMLAMLVSRIGAPQTHHALSRCVGGGCPAGVWEAVQERFGIIPYELYGMTEVGGWVTGNTVADYRFGSCGRARADMQVAILDPDDNLLPAGNSGEIAVRPKAPFTLMLGYWKNPQATLDVSRNLWFHTGDAGSMDADGYLYFQGRMKEIIRRGGENISPTEVEIALLHHPAIRDVAVVGVPDAIYGQEIKALAVVRQPLPLDELAAWLSANVPHHMIPGYVEFTDEIPRTETQKIQRHLLSKSLTSASDLRSLVRTRQPDRC